MLESTRKNYNEDFKREVVRLIEAEEYWWGYSFPDS